MKNKKIWLGLLVGGVLGYYLFNMATKKKTKASTALDTKMNASGKPVYVAQKKQGWTTKDGRYYCPSNVVPCPVDLVRTF
jgi:hypothetical protein